MIEYQFQIEIFSNFEAEAKTNSYSLYLKNESKLLYVD